MWETSPWRDLLWDVLLRNVLNGISLHIMPSLPNTDQCRRCLSESKFSCRLDSSSRAQGFHCKHIDQGIMYQKSGGQIRGQNKVRSQTLRQAWMLTSRGAKETELWGFNYPAKYSGTGRERLQTNLGIKKQPSAQIKSIDMVLWKKSSPLWVTQTCRENAGNWELLIDDKSYALDGRNWHYNLFTCLNWNLSSPSSGQVFF